MNDKKATCVTTAVANSLLLASGMVLSDHEILGAGEDITVENALHYMISLGLELDAMWMSGNPGVLEPGYVLMLEQAAGMHAVMYLGSDEAVSWGASRPLDGNVSETWKINWGGSAWHDLALS